MLAVVGWILLLAVCVMGAGWWFTRRQGAARSTDRSRGAMQDMQWAEFTDTSPLTDGQAELQHKKRQDLEELVGSRDDGREPSHFADTRPAAFPVSSHSDLDSEAMPSGAVRSRAQPPVDNWFEDFTQAASLETCEITDAAGLQTLGRYLIEKPLGQGAMGAVYLARDPVAARHVAIKTMALAREFSGPDLIDARNRFLREADMAGRLQHPGIVQILDAGEAGDLLWIAMELIEGTDLGHYTTPDRLLPLPVVLRTIARAADALAYAHTRGVTHRDIKPDNIMLELKNEGVKVMDFGVARLADASRTRTGVILGTPTYMSPEQLSGQHLDGRTDLYSLGVTLFQLLTGSLPMQATSLGALMRAISRETPPNVCDLRPDLPAALGDIVALALQKHPATRYKSGEQMAEDLRAVLKMLPVSAAPEFDITLS
jgi:tRNA A-37 threonylcarbamoyl transferase component Bud32